MLATLPASAAAGRRWRRTAECNPSSDKYVEEVAAAEPAQRFSHEADGVPQQALSVQASSQAIIGPLASALCR